MTDKNITDDILKLREEGVSQYEPVRDLCSLSLYADHHISRSDKSYSQYTNQSCCRQVKGRRIFFHLLSFSAVLNGVALPTAIFFKV